MAQAARQGRNRLLFLLGGLTGVLVFLLVYGISPLDITNDTFCRGGYIEKDIQQHYAGWLFYRQSDAGIPFCLTDSINYPDGPQRCLYGFDPTVRCAVPAAFSPPPPFCRRPCSILACLPCWHFSCRVLSAQC